MIAFCSGVDGTEVESRSKVELIDRIQNKSLANWCRWKSTVAPIHADLATTYGDSRQTARVCDPFSCPTNQ